MEVHNNKTLMEVIFDELDISFVGITENTPKRHSLDTPILLRNKKDDNKENKSTIEDMENFINEKYNQLEISSFKKELLQEIRLSIGKNDNSFINILKCQNEHLLSEISFLREEIKEKNSVIKSLMDNNYIKNKTVSYSTVITQKVDNESPTHHPEHRVSVATHTESTSQNSFEVNKTPSSPLHAEEQANMKNNLANEENKQIHPNITVGPRKTIKSISANNNDEDKNEIAAKAMNECTNNEKDKSKRKRVVILGDSMIKNLKSWEMSKKVKNASVCVRPFSGAKVRCMKDHIKPSLRENPDHVILHVGTNDLDSDRPPDLIAKSVVDVACSMKNGEHDVTISNLIVRADRFREKAAEVNEYLAKFCVERNLHLIDHSKRLKTQYLNGSKLHLNRRGTPILQDTFCKFLLNVFN